MFFGFNYLPEPIRNWIGTWLLNRSYNRSIRRMIECSHSKTIRVDVGCDATKCLNCWALKFHDGPDTDRWFANSTRPTRAMSK